MGWKRRLHIANNGFVGWSPYPAKGMLAGCFLKSTVGVRRMITGLETHFERKSSFEAIAGFQSLVVMEVLALMKRAKLVSTLVL